MENDLALPLTYLEGLQASPSALPAGKATPEELGKLMTHWHLRLGHISGAKLRELASKGLIPKVLQRAQLPLCESCVLGQATRRPWRTKANYRPIEPRPAKSPGDVTSMDHLQSSTPGFVAQMKGRLTTSRYTGAVIFVDHFSSLPYAHMCKELSVEATIEALKSY